jgi:hypothetical protein
MEMMLKGICGVRDEKGLCDKEEIKKVCVMGEIKKVCVMGEIKKVCVMGEIKKVCVMGEIKKVCVMGERGYLSRTSRPRNAFSPPHPLRWKTGNAFSPQTYKLADYQQFI